MREFPKSDLLRNPCVSVWIFVPNWCERITLLRDRAPGLWHKFLAGRQSDMAKPTPNALLHSGVWMSYQYLKRYLWKLRRNILLPVNRRFYFWVCYFTPSEALQSDGGCDRKQTVFLRNTSVQWLPSGNISVLCGLFLWCTGTEALQGDV